MVEMSVRRQKGQTISDGDCANLNINGGNRMACSALLGQEAAELSGRGLVERIDIEMIQQGFELALIRSDPGAFEDHVPKFANGRKTKRKASVGRG
jgi:hypothetical protein